MHSSFTLQWPYFEIRILKYLAEFSWKVFVFVFSFTYRSFNVDVWSFPGFWEQFLMTKPNIIPQQHLESDFEEEWMDITYCWSHPWLCNGMMMVWIIVVVPHMAQGWMDSAGHNMHCSWKLFSMVFHSVVLIQKYNIQNIISPITACLLIPAHPHFKIQNLNATFTEYWVAIIKRRSASQKEKWFIIMVQVFQKTDY